MKPSDIRRHAAGSRPDYLTLGAFGLSILLGGGNAVAVRFSNAELPPFWGASLRFMGAALILWAIALIRREPLPRGRALAGVLLYGTLNFGVTYAFLYWGLQTVQAGLAQVILALTPLLTLFFAFAHRLEPFRWRGLFGAVLAVTGITLAFVQQPHTDAPLGALLSLVAGAACMAEAGVVVKRFPASPPMITNAMAMSTGTLILVTLSLVTQETWLLPALPRTWAAVAYLTLVGSVALFTLFLFVIRRWTVSATAYQLVLMPFVTVALASLLAGESITGGFLLGGALVLAGVWVGAFARFEKSQARREEPVSASR